MLSVSNTPTDRDSAQPAPGLTLLHVLRDGEGEIYRLSWSPNGTRLAASNVDGCIRVWNTTDGSRVSLLKGHLDRVYDVSWSPDGRLLASASRDQSVRIWNVETGETTQVIDSDDKTVYSVRWSPDGQLLALASLKNQTWLVDPNTGSIVARLEGHSMPIYGLAWSPDGRTLASGSADKTIRLWDRETHKTIRILAGHTDTVISLAWSPDGRILASGSADKTIHIWDTGSKQQKLTIEGHTQYITAVDFSADGRLLASKSGDGTVRLWRCDTWEVINQLDERRNASGPYLAGLAFHPLQLTLATLGEQDTVIRLWSMNPDVLLVRQSVTSTVHYSNAKVVLVGDTGVGKSGLSLVLINKPFHETESTHNRHVYEFDHQRVPVENGVEEIRETLLWDLAGQPGYRLIHQLHLGDISVALIVFDARNELDPFSGVLHWVRALRQAQRQASARGLKIFLVAARTDRGSVGVSRKRINQLMEKLHIDGYYETSAKEGWGIAELIAGIRAAIAWDTLPRVSSTDLFTRIKDFLADAKAGGLSLDNQDSLYNTFLRENNLTHTEPLRAQFDTCIGLVAARGLITRFTFGDLVLLQPELLDSYASALVNAAKNEPDGLGYIREDAALAGDFAISNDERIKSPGQEKLLLIATVEKLLHYEIALRVQADESSFLVFPSQLTRESPDLPSPTNKTVKFQFDGPILNIYATLVVRLAQSGLFRVQEMWKNAVAYKTPANNAVCGLFLNELSDSRAEIILFFNDDTSDYVRYQFEEYVHRHLQRRAAPATLKRTQLTVCPGCNYVVPDQVIELRKQRLLDWVDCPVCGSRLSLVEARPKVLPLQSNWIARMDQVADVQRDRAVATSTLNGKIATGDYDVFLCHNGKDKALVRAIGIKLREQGLLPWLDEWELRPGVPWQKLLEKNIQQVKAAAVFVGDNGVGPWQDMEQAAFIRQFVQRECPVIPVILPTCKEPPQLPYFLSGMTWVDFRVSNPDPFQRLIWGITGERDQAAFG